MSANPSVADIVTAYLKDNGYDGLYADDCGGRAGDLCPCGREFPAGCRAAYAHATRAGQRHGDFDAFIRPQKRKTEVARLTAKLAEVELECDIEAKKVTWLEGKLDDLEATK